jgi:hypothetical protein
MEQNFDYTMPFRNKTSEAGFQFLLTVVFNWNRIWLFVKNMKGKAFDIKVFKTILRVQTL